MVWLKMRSSPAPGARPGKPRVPVSDRPDRDAGPARQPEATAVSSKPVLSQLRELINRGVYPSGERLPSERALAERLGVGRPALREAIRALNALGVLETRHGSGTYVRISGPQALISDPFSLTNSNIGLLDLLEVRKMVEPRAAWLSASRASESHMREIEAARKELEQPGLGANRIAELDLAFHCAILRAAQNYLLLVLHQVLQPLLFEPRALPKEDARYLGRMLAEHATVTDAILRRQADSAEKAMVAHLESWGLNSIAGGDRRE
jgi:GntR family transcriptional repressor for pyruvate dehydrogenase complex